MSAERADRLAAVLAARELDALLVTDLVNVRWLTGYTGSNGLAVLGAEPAGATEPAGAGSVARSAGADLGAGSAEPGAPRADLGALRLFATDFRYVTQAEQQVRGFERAIGETDLLGVVPAALGDGPVRLGFEDQHVSVRTHARLRDLLADDVALVPAGGLVEELRMVKDAAEVRRIRAACELADAALARVLEDGLAGRTERAVALALEQEMQRRGATRPSFATIVAHGPHGALPHATPREEAIAAGSLVTIDWGAELDGYCSDCTRTYAAGRAPDEEARAVYELVREAQLAGLAAVRAGVAAADADAAARDLIAAAGHGEAFGHSLGHGVGLEIHEAPRLSRTSRATLAAGNVVSVEPGVYLPGRLGVRIEDLVVVTDDGCDVLTTLPKDLTVV